ncbi:uncharacterized protein LOC131665274 [Phymastichus coffea]|uniref:uncharacterized protein LOC131665274 n=1 Tax=Phymastichus coffea TaxID=108790 RepID=UPI00273A97BE|nr:uncharacterized protein LOC131665274 [Phymastichus coffea]
MFRSNNTRRITRLDYTRFQMAIKENEFNPIIKDRRLFQQWVVDSYVKIERDRIQYCKNHQKELRVDTYKGLHDHMRNCANDINSHVGKTIILPSSFTGSPRYMEQCYQDTMAIVNETGKPDIFLTMTCNPNWPEIKENLLPGQQAADRPDLVARVFDLKKDRLLDIVIKKSFFGKVASYVYVIEFQKRGLPHMHLLITFEQGFKITTPDVVDKFISAEIPIKIRNPRLYDIVMKNMIHGPCADWCMKDGKCSKHFPKEFQQNTAMDENGFPKYRRTDTGIAHEFSNNRTVDNRWIVPYCPELLKIFDCHINVEIVSSISAIKYLYKYIYKGHDSATVVIGQPENGPTIEHDECRNFIDTRYVGPVEACYRIFSKTMQGKSHTVTRLQVHLPNEQSVIIIKNQVECALLASLNNSSSTLLDYFTLNTNNERARQYFYHEIPKHFTYKKKKINDEMVSAWEDRKKNFNCIGRMYSVSPTQLELFHLRLLLLHVKGAKSYNDLKTVDNVLHPSFTAACLALGIIEDDDEWNKAMREAVSWMMPKRLRHLFAIILIHCQPVHPEELWDTFKDAMSEDFSRHNELTKSYEMAYSEINNILLKEGTSIANFPTMDQNIAMHDVDSNDNDILHHQLQIGNQQYEKLNAEQKEIVDNVITASRSDDYTGSTCFYIDGQGGSGKTFVYTTIYNLLMSSNIKCLTMAFTGIAAILLPSGKTVHKTFGLPVPMFNDSSSNIKIQSNEGMILKNTKIFIWDEAPMAPRYALEIVNRTLKYIMNNDLPFGGKIMILGGDFRQLLPIKVNGTRNEILNLSIKNSELWPLFSKFQLKTNMRVWPHELAFAKYLLDVGNGTVNDQDNNIQLPPNYILPADEYEMNNKITDLLDKSGEHIYTGIDSTENCDNGNLEEVLLQEYLNTLNPPNFPPHKLRLRKFCIVMLIRNISLSDGLCNGTRLQVLDFSNHLLKCKILTGDQRNNIVFLNRITLYCENKYPFTFKRRQFPIKLAFAIIINKSQGQTLEKIGIDLRRDVFNHGQLYVAMSRVRSWDSLTIYLGNQRQTSIVKNYVYTELYQ